MGKIEQHGELWTQVRRIGWILGIVAVGPAAQTQGWQISSNLNVKADLTLKEAFDSNIYLQDNAPYPTNVALARAAGYQPVEANKSSWITVITPKLGLGYKPSPAFGVLMGYAPEVAFYESAHSEDYITHRGTLNFGGKAGNTLWELANTATYIDGSHEGPTFARPDDIPAIGGIPIRDRRDAFIFRNSFRLTQPIGDWFFRPVACAYVHDFKTAQHWVPSAIRTRNYSYENYIDRQDVNGGLDIGYRVAKETHVVVGYRYGNQQQFNGPLPTTGQMVDSPYDSTYNRVLFGLEGNPASWLKVNILVGPEFRNFYELSALHQIRPQFDADEVLVYMDVSIVATLSKADAVTFKGTRFEQPAFSSFSVYEDNKYDLSWRHKFGEKFSTTLGFMLYIGDWKTSSNRDDWIYSPSILLGYNFNQHLGAEANYAYEWVENKFDNSALEPLAKSHEYTRHLVSLRLKYTF